MRVHPSFVLLSLLLGAGCAGREAREDTAEAELALGTPFPLATASCPMAHCDPQLSDDDPLPPPSSLTSVWHDMTGYGSQIGLGCSSNGTIAVCSYDQAPSIVAYGAGARLWDSGTLLDGSAWKSAPMVAVNGDSIAADDQRIVRFGAGGDVIWSSSTTGGAPISPVPLPNGYVVLATQYQSGVNAAPISTFDAATGTPGPSLDLTESDDTGSYVWSTVNTPGSAGNRIYVSMSRVPAGGQGSDPKKKGALFAIDVGSTALTPRWSFVFEAPSGASPTVVGNNIVFDGAGIVDDGSRQKPVLFGIQDDGDSFSGPWVHTMPGPVVCSVAHDPRGGIWSYGFDDTRLFRFAEADGTQLQVINLATSLGLGWSAASAMSITDAQSGNPKMILSALRITTNQVVALDLVTGDALWRYTTPGLAAGQFPVMGNGAGQKVVAFTMRDHGIYELFGP